MTLICHNTLTLIFLITKGIPFTNASFFIFNGYVDHSTVLCLVILFPLLYVGCTSNLAIGRGERGGTGRKTVIVCLIQFMSCHMISDMSYGVTCASLSGHRGQQAESYRNALPVLSNTAAQL